jgi:hypothetical protein
MYHPVTQRLLAGVAAALTAGSAAAAAVPVTRPASEPALPRFAVNRGVSLPQPAGGQAAGMVDGVPVVAGGNDWVAGPRKVWRADVHVFREGRWDRGPGLPHPLADAAFAHDRTGLYVAGGSDGERSFRDVHHLADLGPGARWVTLAPLPAPITSAAGALLDGRFYVACGESGGGMAGQLWSLETTKPGATWQVRRPVPGAPRAFCALVAMGRWLYLLGGTAGWSPLSPLAECLRYDPAADRWERIKDLPFPGYALSASAVDEHRVLLAGCADGRIRSDIWLLDLGPMAPVKAGDAIIQATTAPLLRVGPAEWWLIGGEPDANRHRTAIVTVITGERPD